MIERIFGRLRKKHPPAALKPAIKRHAGRDSILFRWIASGVSALLMGLSTAAYAAPTTWSFGNTLLNGGGQGALISATISIQGEFKYDEVADTVSDVDVTVTINGAATRITNAAPNLGGSFLVLTNNVTAGEPVVFFARNQLVRSGSSATVTVYAGTCRVVSPPPTCNSGDWRQGSTTFAFVAPNTAPVANAGPDQTVASAAAVTLTGLASTDADNNALTYAWTQTSGTPVTLSSTTSSGPTFTAPTLAVGASNATLVFSLIVNDGTTSSSADTVTITVQAPQPTPATEFAANDAQIKTVVTKDAERSLNSAIVFNRTMVRDARERFKDGQVSEEGASTVPLNVDGALDANSTTLSSKGTFFGQADLSGGARRLVFGDFDIQHDSETGSSTATLNGKVAWEQSVSDKTLLGYFIGGELARSNIAGSFDGDQNRIGVNAGGYAVHEIAQQVYVDGFVSLGAGRNNLTMSNGVLDLDSDYTTRSATMGAAVSGVIEQQGFDILPELSLSFGRTWIGDVGFTGAAHSFVDNTLSLDAGTVTLANILFRPEFRVPMDGLSGAKSLQVFSFAPRLSCEQVKTNVTEENCGAGAELGFSGSSVDGLSSVSAKIMADRLGDRTTSSVQLNLQHRF